MTRMPQKLLLAGVMTVTPQIAAAKTAANEVLADADGNGTKEKISLKGGAISVGKVSSQLGKKGWECGASEGEIKIILLNKQTKRWAIAVECFPGEDDASWQLFSYSEKALTRLGTIFVGNGATLPGDDTIVSTAANCGLSRTTTFKVGESTITSSKKETGKYDEKACAACPFVYVETDQGFEFSGEILRNFVGSKRFGRDVLSLRRLDREARRLKLKVAERKPETTHVDAISLSDGSRTVLPIRCNGMHDWPDYCAEDDLPFVLREGESVDLEFDVTGLDVEKLQLSAKGYYDPTP